MHHYEIRTAKRATPQDVERLRRAFGRMLCQGAVDVDRVKVSATRGCFRIDVRVAGSPRHAAREAERLFTVAWYDAFGQRSSTHIGFLDDEPSVRRAAA